MTLRAHLNGCASIAASSMRGWPSTAPFCFAVFRSRRPPTSTPSSARSAYPNFPIRRFAVERRPRGVHRTPRVHRQRGAADVTIFLHHEMAQTPIYPSKLFFFCEQAAPKAGPRRSAGPTCCWERLTRRMPAVRADCEAKGLRYTNVMPTANDPTSGMGRSWQSTLRSETRRGRGSGSRRLGYSWEWLPDGCLRATTPVLPAVMHRPTGRKAFFNQLIAAFQGWKDSRNDPRRRSLTATARRSTRGRPRRGRLADELTFDVPWQRGDVVLVDNYVAMHGRRSFTGKRKVLASLVAA